MDNYIPLLVLLVLAAALVTALILLSVMLGPKRHSAMKDDPFECGTIGTGDASQRLSVKFYLVAVIFILFDVEIIFLYPWAVQVVDLGWQGFMAVLTFLFVVVTGLAYIWKRGVLDWS